jgi:hypothetical protein
MTMNAYREMAAAMRSRTGFDATVLKFSKGLWLGGKNAVQMNERELIAHVHESAYGWIKWLNKRMVDFNIGFTRDRFHPKKRVELDDNDPNLWLKGDPWSLTFLLPLSDPRSTELFIYSTTSRGGKDALANLQDAYADNCEQHPEDGGKLPLIQLASSWYPHPDYGRVEVPVFDIVGWRLLAADVRPIRLPVSTAAVLIEHKPSDDPDDTIPL